MKILIVGPFLPFGGVSRYVKDLLNFSDDYILFNTARSEKRKIHAGTGYIEAFNAGVLRTIKGILATIWNMLKFPFSLLRSRARIVHICGVSFFPFWENSWYAIIAKLFGRKVTLHYLGAFDQFYYGAGGMQKCLIRIVMKTPDRLMFLSEKVRMLASSFIKEDKLFVLPSSVDTNKFNSPDRRFPTQDGEVRILFIGGLDPFRKGVYDLLAAVETIVTEIPGVKLIMTGGDSFDEVKEVWQKKKLDQHIQFLGWIDEEQLPDLYTSADILALPSYNEGLPYVVIEALSSGLPVVGSNVGGIPEVIEHGQNGFIINPGDINVLAARLELLAKNSTLREQISRKNRVKAINFYSLNPNLNNLYELFQQLSPGSGT